MGFHWIIENSPMGFHWVTEKPINIVPKALKIVLRDFKNRLKNVEIERRRN